MHFFSNYLQPLVLWLHDHPNWALLITFFISFAESLAIIGSIVPGSVTMTAVGILAGSGVMRIDLTFVAATLGAVAGDGASYALGYIFRDRLINVWPFSRYPNWLSLGKDYFSKHGGKSVVVGRFVGPLRSIIPVIAGMMGMSHWRFFLANFISALGWSILYVLPGVLIGAASSELSPESATRLFLLVLFLLAGLWLLSVGLKWLFIRLNHILRKGLHSFWSWSREHPYLARLFIKVTPVDEINYYPTAAIVILFILSSVLFCLLSILVIHQSWITDINEPVHLFLQSLRTKPFDSFFIVVSELSGSVAVVTLIIAVASIAIYFRDWRSLSYWLSLCLTTTIVLLFLYGFIHYPRPRGLLEVQTGNSFPLIGLTYAASLFTAFMFFLNAYCVNLINRFVKIILSISLFLAGFAPVYLGDNWLTDVLGAYLCGFSLSLIHWLFYRQQKPVIHCSAYGPLSLSLVLIIFSFMEAIPFYRQELHNHQPYLAQYLFTDDLWWDQSKPLLPIYRTNRIGNRISVFNIQYAGSLNNLEQSLSSYGWRKVDDSFFNSLISRVSGQPAAQDLPLMAQLYLNKKPMLMMIFQPNDGNPVQVLRIWRSNFHLKSMKQPIWLGSVHPRRLPKNQIKNQPISNVKNRPASIYYVSAALSQYMQRQVSLPIKFKLPVEVEPILLLIKEPSVSQEP
ncbi:VTT domain-containing protein [Legionella jordanis]|uniref:Secretion system protein Y n=1 Tax=Legionella jordanis TaxID=456 RepID=A0A0W0VAR3_9GAMM|nr:VTT domain-containing protein [Legionella jordanis]KTD17217.1 secretion system protein Y [Legionella jordanis]RMX03335.1 hypothetical protein EAW55_07925 [Legionella jordanis]RMX15814.1 hypothetical protein EAS68_11280 [Legionella jordanis]VEH12585.1 DedA/PAP2 domain protein [Legionella jordanis]HAT8713341.1 hypothetical protein [Legionella jordanis]